MRNRSQAATSGNLNRRLGRPTPTVIARVEGDATRDLIASLGSWDECLVCITGCRVWPSGEDWPQFYAWRGALDERRSLDVAPGRRFDSGEFVLLAELLELIMTNAWDADVLCSRNGRADGLRGIISHDEWYQVLGPSSRTSDPEAARASTLT